MFVDYFMAINEPESWLRPIKLERRGNVLLYCRQL